MATTLNVLTEYLKGGIIYAGYSFIRKVFVSIGTLCIAFKFLY